MRKGNIKPSFRNDIAFFSMPPLALAFVQQVLNIILTITESCDIISLKSNCTNTQKYQMEGAWKSKENDI